MPPSFFFFFRSFLTEIFARVLVMQDHCGDGPDDDCVTSEPTEGGHDGDCDQRANDYERVPDGEGENAAENWAVLAVYVSPSIN